MALHIEASTFSQDMDIDTCGLWNLAGVHLRSSKDWLFLGRRVESGGPGDDMVCRDLPVFLLALAGVNVVGHPLDDEFDWHEGGIRRLTLFPDRLVIEFEDSGKALVGDGTLEVSFHFTEQVWSDLPTDPVRPTFQKEDVYPVLRRCLRRMFANTDLLVDHDAEPGAVADGGGR